MKLFFPQEIKKDLSSDDRLLLEHVFGISKFNVNLRFVSLKIGHLDPAR